MAMAIFWLTTTNTIIILWVLSHSEPIELFWIISLTFQCHFELLTLFRCSCPYQTCSNHHHHPNFMTFFQSARAAFCGRYTISGWIELKGPSCSSFEASGTFYLNSSRICVPMNTFTEFKLSGSSNMRFYHPDKRIEKDMEEWWLI